jgi:hypothetical protein
MLPLGSVDPRLRQRLSVDVEKSNGSVALDGYFCIVYGRFWRASLW